MSAGIATESCHLDPREVVKVALAIICLVSLLLAASAITKPEQVSFEEADGVRVFGDIHRSANGQLEISS